LSFWRIPKAEPLAVWQSHRDAVAQRIHIKQPKVAPLTAERFHRSKSEIADPQKQNAVLRYVDSTARPYLMSSNLKNGRQSSKIGQRSHSAARKARERTQPLFIITRLKITTQNLGDYHG
ncbi:MAG: hypothetical protein J6A24_05090, partial [Clostridia bacterium]|nr:hypothetical protein [Clostridia bacterium]